jgi:hypothetical protein
MDLHKLTLAETARLIQQGKASSLEVTGHYLRRNPAQLRQPQL